MRIKIIIVLVILLGIQTICIAQDSLIFVKKYPVKSGYIKIVYDNFTSYHDFADYLKIVSSSDTALAMYDSNVIDIFTLDSSLYVILSNGMRRRVIYGNLTSINVAKGEKIKKGQMIGLIRLDANGKFTLLVKLMNGLNEVSYEKHLSIFKSQKY